MPLFDFICGHVEKYEVKPPIVARDDSLKETADDEVVTADDTDIKLHISLIMLATLIGSAAAFYGRRRDRIR